MEEMSAPDLIRRSDGSEVGSISGALGTAPSVSSVRRRKVPQGSHMSLEELRINKGLLKEISKKKKQTMQHE